MSAKNNIFARSRVQSHVRAKAKTKLIKATVQRMLDRLKAQAQNVDMEVERWKMSKGEG